MGNNPARQEKTVSIFLPPLLFQKKKQKPNLKQSPAGSC
jgi:hypothetical protein